jgi:hypothetical protein
MSGQWSLLPCLPNGLVLSSNCPDLFVMVQTCLPVCSMVPYCLLMVLNCLWLFRPLFQCFCSMVWYSLVCQWSWPICNDPEPSAMVLWPVRQWLCPMGLTCLQSVNGLWLPMILPFCDNPDLSPMVPDPVLTLCFSPVCNGPDLSANGPNLSANCPDLSATILNCL